MKTRTLGVLAVILALLACLTWVDYQRAVNHEAAEVERARVVASDTGKIRSLTVSNAQGEFRLERKADPDNPGEEAWWITAPVAERADQKVVTERMLAPLDEARKFGRFDLLASERAAFGLDKAAVQVTLGFDGGATQQLDLGRESPVREQVYLCDAADPHSAWITSVDLKKAFDKRAIDVRDKSAVDFDYKRLQHIRVSAGDREVATLERDGLTKWDLSVPDGPPGLEADPRHVEELFQLLQAMAPVDTTSATLALEPLADTETTPQVTIELASRTAANADAPHTVILHLAGYPNAERSAAPSAGGAAFTGVTVNQFVYRAKLADRALLFEADSRLALALRDPLHTFRDRRIVTLPKDQITWVQIEVQLGELTSVVAFERASPSEPWRFASEADRPFNQQKADQYLSDLQALQVDSFDPQSAPVTPGAAGLTEPLCRVTIATADRSRVEGFEVGQPVAKDSSLYYARRLTGSGRQISPSAIVTLALAEAHVAKLCRAARYFTVRNLLSFDSERVARLEVGLYSGKTAAEGTTMTLTRAASGDWSGRMGDAPARTVTTEDATLLVSTLSGLEYLVAPERVDDETRKQEGLDDPVCRLHIFDASGALLGGLTFGPRPEKKLTLLVQNHLGQYRYVETSALNSLQQAMGQVMSRLR